MDRTSINVVIICVIVLITWTKLANKIYPPKPLPPRATNEPAAPLNSTSTASAAVPAGAPFTPLPVANTNVAEETQILETPQARYTFSSYGGGLKLVELQIKIES